MKTNIKHISKWKLVISAALALVLVVPLAGCAKDPTAAPTTPVATSAPVEATPVPTEAATPTAETTAPTTEPAAPTAEPATPTPEQAATAGGELRWGESTEPSTLDPLSAAGTADGRSILFNVFEGLVKPNTDGGFIDAIAESHEISDDALTYTFKIRQNVKFHNGATVNAQDVIYSLNLAKEAAFSGLDRIVSIEAPDDGTVVITLANPDTYFLPYLTVGVVPDGYTDRENNPVGTGPFKIEAYNPQQNLILVKNTDYWQAGLPKLDKVTLQFVGDSAALLTALQSGSIEGASINYNQYLTLDQSKYTAEVDQSDSAQALFLNNTFEPFTDLRVRQALNYAVNVQEIIDLAFAGQGEKSATPLVPGLKSYYNSDVNDDYPYDVEKAKALLAEAGYADGFALKITVPSNYQMHVDTAQVLVNQLAAINVSATIDQVDWPTWLENVYRGRQYEATIISLDSSTLAPSGFLSRYRTESSSNFVNFSNADYDAVYAEASTTLDEAVRIARYKEAQQIISDNAVSVFIQDIYGFKTIENSFTGLVSYPLYVFDYATIEKK